ncbi:Orf y [Tanacetum coccineum]
MCKDAVLSKELRDLSLCSAIPIPGYYKNYVAHKGKPRTYKGKPHNSHVKPFKRKYKDDRGRAKKCKCFICGKEGHFAKYCRSKQGNIARSAVYQELGLDDNWDIVSADFDDSSVYSISEGEWSWKPNKELPTQSKSYEHDWKENTVTNYTICINQKRKKTSTRKEELWQSEKSLLVKDLTNALEIIYQLKTEQIRLEEQKDEEIRKLKTQLQKEIEKETEA